MKDRTADAEAGRSKDVDNLVKKKEKRRKNLLTSKVSQSESLAQSLVKSLGTTKATLLLMMIGTEREEARLEKKRREEDESETQWGEIRTKCRSEEEGEKERG